MLREAAWHPDDLDPRTLAMGMPTATVHEGTQKLHYQQRGTGPLPLVLLHGFPFHAAQWRPQLAALTSFRRVIAPDFRGFGASAPSRLPYSIARLASDIDELLEGLGIESAIIAGLSMGGYVAFELYKRRPSRVAALVLADTRPDPDSPDARAARLEQIERIKERGTAPVIERLLPQLIAPGTRNERPAVVDELRRLIASATGEAMTAALSAMAERSDSRPLLDEIECPVLVVAGEHDALTPPDPTRAWAASIAGARVEIIEAAGHVANLEQPELFNALLLDFLGAVAPAKG